MFQDGVITAGAAGSFNDRARSRHQLSAAMAAGIKLRLHQDRTRQRNAQTVDGGAQHP